MVNKDFEAYKINREIKRSGTEYKFKRSKENKYGEPTNDDTQEVCTLQGLYHEENSSVKITTGDTTQIRNKKIPMILCLYEDAATLLSGDFVMVNNNTFSVTGITNIQEWNIIADISLEVIDNGKGRI